VEHVVAELGVPERRACRVLGQHRSTQRKPPSTPDDEAALTADIVALATRYGRYGYRRITALLRDAGWVVNRKRVERIWRREGLKVPRKHPKKGRLWLNDGSCLRLRPEHPNQVWSYDFVEDRTHDGRNYRMLNLIDEDTRECLAIRVDRKLNSVDVVDVLSDLFILRGVPGHIRSDNGPEFVATAVRAWIAAVGAKTAYIEPGSPLQGHRAGPGPCGSGSTALLSMGERLPRELQRPAARRTARGGDFLLPPGGPDRHRRMAAALQHPPPPFSARLQGTSSRGGPVAGPAGHPDRGPKAGHALTSQPDHPMGAGH
jgi:putative transposase